MSQTGDQPLFAPGDIVNSLTVVGLLGQGGYGAVYCVKSPDCDIFFAMKVEPKGPSHNSLSHEIIVLNYIQGSPYFPRLFASGETDRYRYLVIDLLGPSISKARHQAPDYHFSLETTLRLALFMFQCLRAFHGTGLVHGDVKPGNFLLSGNADAPVVLIDFGFAKRFVDKSAKYLLPERPKVSYRGTPKYSSTFAHLGYDQCPRDDLISWMYSLVELVEGELPWSYEPTRQKVYEKKSVFSPILLLKKLPSEFLQIWKYLQRLKFASVVNYRKIYFLLRAAVQKECRDLSMPFDWESLPASETKYTLPMTGPLPAGIACGKKVLDGVPENSESQLCNMCTAA
jgi:serine/threonine protein kinase